MSETAIEQLLARELAVNPRQVWAALRLLDAGATVPFIARYRKEATGGMTDTHLRLLAERLESIREFEKRRLEVLHAIEDAGKLTPPLRQAVLEAATGAALEDLYLPFRTKKQSKANDARIAGLGPLAERLLGRPSETPEALAAAFVDPERGIPDAAAALEGARQILLEKIAEDAALVGRLRERLWETGWAAAEALPGAADPERKFADYARFREPLRQLPSHRTLALLRGRQEGVLRVWVETEAMPQPGRAEDAEYTAAIRAHLGVRPEASAAGRWMDETVRKAWKTKLKVRLEIDLLARARARAEDEAIRVFADNLRHLLLAAPAGARPVLGLDPGFRAGVKAAVVDAAGRVAAHATVFPHPPQSDAAGAARTLAGLLRAHAVEYVAVGNGTGSRETERFVSEILRAHPDLPARCVMVSEAGASVYSASELAARELAGLDVTIRGAVSIARRLQDPLAELVKIDPKSVGVGQYQHDVNQRRLAQTLRGVVEDCVNTVGVDVNTASVQLLSYVAGLNERTAERLVEHRARAGGVRSRKELAAVPEWSPRVFEQAAGFLRVRGGDDPLDESAVHPEAYPLVEKLLADTGRSLREVIGNRPFLSGVDPSAYADERFGEPTVRDILAELEKPGRDPRPSFRAAAFREDVREPEDLKPGMMLEGVVTNVANFGAFVDVGVHQDGLVHVSEMADHFVEDPRQVLRPGQVVRVRVLDVDLERRRIALSLRRGSAARASSPR